VSQSSSARFAGRSAMTGQHDERVVVDGQERVLREGVALMADRPGLPIRLQLGVEIVDRQRHVGEQVVDRDFGCAVGDEFTLQLSRGPRRHE
jgi:hypothetical protein